MDKNRRRTIEGWIRKARNHLRAAEEHLESHIRYSECVEASQECVELSVKALLSLLDLEYAPSHGWSRQHLAKIASQIHERRLLHKLADQDLGYIRLPRLLFLANFWAQFYLTAKYGLEAGYLAPAQELFQKQEADLAVEHARECLNAASQLGYLSEDRLAAIVSCTEDSPASGHASSR